MTKTTSGDKGGRPCSSYRFARWFTGALGAFFVLLIVLYLAALADEHYESRRGLRTYSQILTVQLGDTVTDFNRKIPGCKIGQNDGVYVCVVQTVTNNLLGHFDWYMMHSHENAYMWQNVHRQKFGLRDWLFRSWVTVHEGRIIRLDSQFVVVGRDKMLGCSWGLAPELRGADPTLDAKTALTLTHITSSWSGSGYRMDFTPGSEQSELRMREVNDICLTSFVGCRDSRELLPNLPSVADGRPRYW